jgi:Caspase domain
LRAAVRGDPREASAGARPAAASPSRSAATGSFSYEESHALLISAGAYRQWPRLTEVASEIDEVADALRHRGFSVAILEDPDAEQLRDGVKSFIDRYGYRPDNRLLLFFSGHGHTRNQRGYIVPVNAPNPVLDEPGFLSTAIPMLEVMTWARRIEAKHALFVFDSCFAGTLFETRALPDPTDAYVRSSSSRPVRQFITAGDAGQEVPARSIFTPLFIRGIDGDADFTRDGYVTASELGVYLSQRVPDYGTGQTPQYGKIRDPDLDEGDFVFEVRPGSGAAEIPMTERPMRADPERSPAAGPDAAPAERPDQPPPPSALADGSLVLWKVGSPHDGRTPDPRVPRSILERARELSLNIRAESIDPRDFFSHYVDAYLEGNPPDIVSIDNYGHLDGITTDLGSFKGIYAQPGVQEDLIFATETLDELGRGWQLLTRGSPNFEGAVKLALPAPDCPYRPGQNTTTLGQEDVREMVQVLERATRAYMACDQAAFLQDADHQSLDDGCSGPSREVVNVAICPPFGTESLAFVPVTAAVRGEGSLGQSTLLAAMRKRNGWSVLTLSDDPVTHGLIANLPAMSRLYVGGGTRAPAAAELETGDGIYPAPSGGARFGNFVWRRPSRDPAALEIAEFNYGRSSRLFATPKPPSGPAGQSSGSLWSTNGAWRWRIWSIGPGGEIAFSDTHSFTH